MSRFVLVALFVAIVSGAVPAASQGFGGGPGRAPEILLSEDKINRILAALPEVVAETSAQQSAFMQGLTGAGAQAPEMSPDAVKRLQAIFSKHRYTMQEFAIDVSVLIATYFTLDPAALERQLPTENNPEIRAILDDSAVPQATKDELRRQLVEFQKNKHKVVANLAMLASDHNQKLVKPHLARVAKVLELVREAGKQAAAPKPVAGPRRKKASD